MHTEILNRDIAIVKDSKAIRFMLNPKSARYFLPFLNRELCLTQAAKIVGVKPSSMLYRIRQMLELNLLQLTKLKSRRGKAIKYYKSSFYGYFIPFINTEYESPEIMTRKFALEAEKTLDKSLTQSWKNVISLGDNWGIRLIRTDNGVVDQSIVQKKMIYQSSGFLELLTENNIYLWDQYRSLYLSLDEAKELQADLSKVCEKYTNKKELGKKPYFIRLAMAPSVES